MLKIYYTKAPSHSRDDEKRTTEQLLEYSLAAEGVNDFLIAKSENGKPHIVGSPFSIGISHKDGYVFVAVSDAEVGLDFEKIGCNNPVMAARILPADEYVRYLASKKPAEFLYTAFSARECYSKLTGVGFPVLLSREPLPVEVRRNYMTLGQSRYVLSVCGDCAAGFDFAEVVCLPFSAL